MFSRRRLSSTSRDDPASGVSALVGIPRGAGRRFHRTLHRNVDLRGEHHVVAPTAGEGFADDDLRFALRVGVGGVDEVDAGIEGGVDRRDRGVVVEFAPTAEHHRPETQRADLGFRFVRGCGTPWVRLYALTIYPS